MPGYQSKIRKSVAPNPKPEKEIEKRLGTMYVAGTLSLSEASYQIFQLTLLIEVAQKFYSSFIFPPVLFDS